MGENRYKGKVNGQLIHSSTQMSDFPLDCEAMFSMELKEDIPDTPLKTGDSIVVSVSTNHSRVYVRIGDEVEVVGKVQKKKLKRREGKISYMIESKGLLNETLGFSRAY
ncbi:MAG: hypothetical protein HWN66_16970 [Candidatus Helarchaeota archaeon]|nr:hypothetical protein [Candidatus Helarchaeota archaeon]